MQRERWQSVLEKGSTYCALFPGRSPLNIVRHECCIVRPVVFPVADFPKINELGLDYPFCICLLTHLGPNIPNLIRVCKEKIVLLYFCKVVCCSSCKLYARINRLRRVFFLVIRNSHSFGVRLVGAVGMAVDVIVV